MNPDERAAMKNAIKEALTTSTTLISIARRRFPKSIKHPARFSLELASAANEKAIAWLVIMEKDEIELK